MTTATLLTRDEIIRGLVDAGVPRHKAERAADEQLRDRGEYDMPPRDPDTGELPYLQLRAPMPDPVQTSAVIRFPLSIVLPWSHLVSDNQRHGAILRRAGPNHTPTPLLIMGADYREAKGRVMKLARAVVAGAEAVALPLRLEARVWVPSDARRRYDVCNYAKAVHDALSKIVYVDDEWLHDVRWIRAGVDVDRPRAEITITPLASP